MCNQIQSNFYLSYYFFLQIKEISTLCLTYTRKVILLPGTKVCLSNIIWVISKLIEVKFRNSLWNIDDSIFPLGLTKLYNIYRGYETSKLHRLHFYRKTIQSGISWGTETECISVDLTARSIWESSIDKFKMKLAEVFYFNWCFIDILLDYS